MADICKEFSACSLDSSLKLEKLLADSPFTVGWILKSLGATDDSFKAFAKNAMITKVTAVDISEGKGFVSKVYNVSIFNDQTKDPYCVIMKVPGAESFADAAKETLKEGDHNPMQESQIAALHNAECDFYLNFAKHVDIPLPKVFEIQKTLVEKNQRGVLLMESLVGKCDQCPLQGDATEEQVYEVAKQITKYQSYILSLPTDQWLGKHKKDEILKTFTKADFFGPFFQRVKQLKPGEFDHGIEVLSKYSNQFNFAWYTSVGVGQDIGLPMMLCHGDFCNQNLLWKTNPDGSLSNKLAAIIDWQAMHEGCLTTDLARFLCINLSGELRRRIEDDVLQFYYNELKGMMAEMGKKVDFSIDQVKRAYRANFVSQSIVAMIAGPFLLANKEWTNEERPKKQAEFDHYMERARMAMEDGLERLEELPKEKLMD